ncbi:unnamed protein product [Haemonchus placei]|uniref:Rick_17kDa_Anti domain-containing protein n=1 Tax=Haemonchus placei TaxID=6290 RepID=A0A0N4WUV3_HAEPC|nr:unnamed protein product [Haemonchus placei]
MLRTPVFITALLIFLAPSPVFCQFYGDPHYMDPLYHPAIPPPYTRPRLYPLPYPRPGQYFFPYDPHGPTKAAVRGAVVGALLGALAGGR